MTNGIHSQVSELAANFASAIVAAIRRASIEDLRALAAEGTGGAPRRGPGRPRKTAAATPAPRKAATTKPAVTKTAVAKTAAKPASAPAATTGRKAKGRLPRRSADQIAKALEKVVTLVKSSKVALRSEQIRDKLGMDKKEMPRVLKEGLDKKVLKSKGQKRSTTYSLA